MTSIADRGYDPRAQGFPDGFDRADSEFQIAEGLRPHYRRTADLDRERVAALRVIQREPFAIPDHLWPPGGGIAPPVTPAASAGRAAAELLAHYCALRDADLEAREHAAAASDAADRAANTCSACHGTDLPAWPRGGALDALEPSPFGGPRLCEPCAQLIRRGYRARVDADADRAALEDTPAGPRGEACGAWLRAALGEDR